MKFFKKSIILLLISLWVLINYGFWQYNETEEYAIPKYEPQLSYEEISWKLMFYRNKADAKWFNYYKLVFSTNNEKPVYPDNEMIYYSSNIDELSTLTDIKEWFWRLCYVYKWYYAKWNDTNYRKCSNTIKIWSPKTTQENKTDKSNKTSTEKIKSKNDSNIKNKLSDETKKKLNQILENFKYKLDKTDATTQAKINKITQIITKFKDKQKTKRSANVAYVIEKLEIMKNTYSDDTNEIEEILNS